VEVLQKSLDERRLSHARLSGHYEDAGLAAFGPLEFVQQRLEFRVAADEIRVRDGVFRRWHRSRQSHGDRRVVRDVEPIHHLARPRPEPRVLLQHLENQLIERAWKVRVQEHRGLRGFPHQLMKGPELRWREKGMPAGDELVQQDAEREYVRFRSDPLATCLLRRHVANRAEHESRFGGGGRRSRGNRIRLQAGQAEIQQLHVTVVTHHHVVGLDVAMDDLRRMRDRQRFGDLARDCDHPRQRQCLCRERPHRGPLDKLHRDVAIRADDAGFVNRHDVRMIERGGESGFAKQAIERRVVRDQRAANHLQCDVALELRILRTIHLAHTAGAKLRHDVIVAETGTRCEGQAWECL
jgi:hypothetical protein